ncbi:MAG: M48 family metalloprotease [Planctomycetes bacterium]|nr:M48 family metalloprotease [Planctomycetota bacterium]
MGNLIWALAAVLLIHLAEPSLPARGARAAWEPLAFTALAVAAGWIVVARVRLRRAQVVLPAFGLAMHALCLFGTGWLDALRDLGVRDWPWLGMLVALGPFLALHARANAVLLRAEGLAKAELVAVLRLRLEMELFPLVPFLFLDGCIALSALWPPLRIAVEQVELVLWGAVAVSVIAMLYALPALLKIAWRLQPLPASPLRRLLEQIAARMGFAFGELYVWPTGHQMANAAIVGAGRRRIVVFTDLLLERLHDEEVAAVFAHEAAHARRHHVRRYAALGFGALLLAWLAADHLAQDELWLAWGPWSAAEEIPLALRLGAEALVLLAIGTAWWFGFGRLSRACEREADLVAMQAVGSGALFRSALLEVCRSMGQPLERGGWRHDSPLHRAAFQQRLEVDPPLARSFAQRLRGISFALQGALLVLVAAKVWLYLPALPVEWIRVELGLGAYDRARSHAAWLGDPEDRREVEALAELGRATRALVPSHDARVAHLLDRARSEAERGAIDLAWRCLTLARLEGEASRAPELAPLLERARFLRDHGFRSAFSRWERWCADREHRVSDALRSGVEAYLAGPSGAGPGL